MHSLENCSPLQHSQNDSNRLMLTVILACIPGALVSTWFFGFGLILNFLIAAAFAISFEAVAITLRGRSVRTSIRDNSALLSAMLFSLAIPPNSAWWLIAAGMFFAIVICKHLYGGLGQNPFNPAMGGYLFLLIAFPLELTAWHIPSDSIAVDQVFTPLSWQGFKQSIQFSLPFLVSGPERLSELADGLALATPLIEYKLASPNAIFTSYDEGISLFSRHAGTGWELTNCAHLLGGLFLLYKRVISWHIPFSIIATVSIVSLLFYSPSTAAIFGTPYMHLFGSATMLGAFFIATDPVSAATSNRGRIVYGIIIGCAIYGIRVWGSYLDSIAIAVLFGNFCAPLLDHYCRPRIYGHSKTPKFIGLRVKSKS